MLRPHCERQWHVSSLPMHPASCPLDPMLDLLSEADRRWRRLLWPAAIALLGIAALPLDLPIARWFHDGHCPSEILRWLGLSEVYAYGFGVACILLTVVILDFRRRELFPRVLAIVIGGGLTADLLKLLLARTRPRSFDLSGTIGETFGQWLPLGNLDKDHLGFPSGHMAAAIGLTAALIWLYPRGRWLFPFFAVLAGCQRLSSGAHFLSDVIWGAAAGSIPAVLFLPGGVLASWFDRLEAWFVSPGRDVIPTSPASSGCG
jgi:membrane-associated phospholipid phosphatase